MPLFKLVLGNEYKDADSTTKTVTDAFVYPSDVDTQYRPTQWSRTELWLEFKRAASFYGFKDDSPDEWVSQTESSRDCRGQLAGYAANTLNVQHRKHLFSLNLGPDGVRFFKWERTYTIVSRAFDLSTEGKCLVEFLYRFSTLTDGDRGKDETVTPATEEERSMAEPLLQSWIHPDEKDQRGFVKIRVPDGASEREVIAGPAIAVPRNIPGRATLGLPVYDVKENGVRFLKDSWRDVNLPQESDILQTLNKKNVRNVPTFVCGGIIPGQITTSHMYIKDTWNFGAHPPLTCIRKHQRTLTVEVGQPLKKFRSSKQLTRVVYEAFLAHEDAFTLCEILHRDVSGGNILIVYDKETPEDDHEGGGRGLLNDWDMAIRMADLDKPARQVERTGTWQFMSIGLLRNRNKKHEAQDDFESFIYVMLHHGLRYMTHSAVGHGLRNIISSIFDIAIDVGNGQWVGALGKGALVHGSGPLPEDFHFACVPFTKWIEDALEAINEWDIFSQSKRLSTKKHRSKPAMDFATLVFCDHQPLKLMWQKMLGMDGWPRNDHAKYQLEPRGNKRPSEDSAQPAPKRRKSGRFTAAAASGNVATPA
ncbi:uncharacterized protein BT62DRAFT_889320 [Guyanagaster necrorhizus]|uniref:Fungal-type protein kinase domain-containing protein n=1 Tax=Guyanagaster necrorhizus TaxID=856835 RepID=A0A9P8AUR8_9AGAR|nr:uncharacterized protein BT62DRAFT_889320 [Guyanagaster necrorhizus MCA 3950]KAG7448789.1 hypothetical protein BT62DRAFT_889320 [Guyanagaster necrorhizus MCA 3950]